VQLFAFLNFSWIVVAVLVKSYAFYPGLEIRRSLGKLLNTVLIHAAVLALLLVSLKGYYYSRLFFTYYYLLFVPALFVVRSVLISRFRHFLQKEKNAQAIAVIGATPQTNAFAQMLANHPEYGMRIAMQLPDDCSETAQQTAKGAAIREVFCGLPPHHPQIAVWMKWADANLIRFRYLPELGLRYLGNASIQIMDEVPVLSLRKEPLEFWLNRAAKRAFDLVFSALIILFFFPILFPLLAILIKASSRGPVFFRQQRSGLNNEVFTVLKFRTMRMNPQADERQATADDARITPIGKFLRMHSLDELPQFFNVVLGHMSVVGPRPHMLMHTAAYRQMIDAFMVRHLIKPGITGLAQVQGLRGETTDPLRMRDRVKADVYYVENWSLLLDLKIIAETIWNMIFGKGRGV
jgi:Undecaprenyl-phosphate glucose phosphotransferase